MIAHLTQETGESFNGVSSVLGVKKIPVCTSSISSENLGWRKWPVVIPDDSAELEIKMLFLVNK